MQDSPVTNRCCLFLLAALVALAVPLAQADLYWCEIDSGSSKLVQKKIEGAECRLVQKSPEPEKGSGEKPANALGSAPQQEKKAASPPPDGFPVVSPQEQATRDGTREDILRFELQVETHKMQEIRKKIEINNNRLNNPELEAYYRSRFETHIQNIKALRQELARLQ